MHLQAAFADDHSRGVALVTGAALIWSLGGLVARLVETDNSWTTIFWRSASAFAFLLAYLALTDGRSTPRRFAEMGWQGLVVGLCFAGASISFIVALSLTSVAKTLIIMSSTPLIAAVFGLAFLGESIGRATYLTIAAVMVGTVIMVSGSAGGGSFAGDVVAILVPISLAGAIVVSRSNPHIRMLPAACLGAGLAALISLPLAAPFDVTTRDLTIMFLFGSVQLGLGLVLFVTGVRLIAAAQSALIGMLEPILGPVWVWLALGERPTAPVVIGGAIVIASVAARTFFFSPRQQPELPVA
jgi:drug/metabolite transporter (DMT)-like permease